MTHVEEVSKNHQGGVRSLMKEISSGAELSRIYTNHSVHATCITLLSKANVPSRHIMTISGHKSESSSQYFNQRLSQSQFYECSSIASAGKENEYGRPCPTPVARNYSTATLTRAPSGFVTGCQIGALNIVVNNSNNLRWISKCEHCSICPICTGSL